MIWVAYIKLVAYHKFIKGFYDSLACVYENKSKCGAFYIVHLSVRYKIYLDTFLFDLGY